MSESSESIVEGQVPHFSAGTISAADYAVRGTSLYVSPDERLRQLYEANNRIWNELYNINRRAQSNAGMLGAAITLLLGSIIANAATWILILSK